MEMIKPPSWLLKHGREARGFIYIGASRGPAGLFAAVYQAVALNYLAVLIQDCDGFLFGGRLKTSSIFSAVVVAEGVLNALLTLWVGNFVDSTSHRKFWLGFFHSGVFVFGVVQLVLLNFSGEVVLIIYTATGLIAFMCYAVVTVLAGAYLPEIGRNVDDMTQIVAKQFAIANSLNVLTVVLATGISLSFDDGGLSGSRDGDLVQLALGIVLINWLIWSFQGFTMLGERPKRDEHKSSMQYCGLGGILEMVQECYQLYPNVGLFLLGFIFYSPGIFSIVALSTTYLLGEVGLTGFEASLASGLAIIISAPAALLTSIIQRRTNLKYTLLLVLGLFLVVNISLPNTVVGQVNPDPSNSTILLANNCTETSTIDRIPKGNSRINAFIFGAVIGIAVGMVYATSNAFYATLIPGGKEASYIGLKAMCSRLLSWLPPLVYTIINEKTGNRPQGILFNNIFFVVGIAFILMINPDKAMIHISTTMDKRHAQNML